jgi:hypothetical protein
MAQQDRCALLAGEHEKVAQRFARHPCAEARPA